MRTAAARATPARRPPRLPPLALLVIFHWASAAQPSAGSWGEDATAKTLQALTSLFGEPVALHALTHGSSAAVVAFKAAIHIGSPTGPRPPRWPLSFSDPPNL